MIEEWETIPEFPNYQISSFGRVYNSRRQIMMQTSLTNHGHTKITLNSEVGHERHTRSVAQLVAEAFVEPPNALCDNVVILDGNFANVTADNIVWRPRWYAWKYTRQLKMKQPLHYKNLAVINTVTGAEYDSIIDAGMSEGLLFDDIWRSTYTKAQLFPYGHTFEIVERV